MSLCSGNSPTIFLDESEDGMSQSQFLPPSAQSDRSSETNGKDEWNRLKDQLKPLLIEDGGLSSIQSGEN